MIRPSPFLRFYKSASFQEAEHLRFLVGGFRAAQPELEQPIQIMFVSLGSQVSFRPRCSVLSSYWRVRLSRSALDKRWYLP